MYGMTSNEIETRAHDFVEALSSILPQMQFHVYTDPHAPPEATGIYIFGFITREVLIGGYAIEAERLTWDFSHQVLTLSQFFGKAWALEETRFYPEALHDLYERHRASGTLWRRVA